MVEVKTVVKEVVKESFIIEHREVQFSASLVVLVVVKPSVDEIDKIPD